MKGLYGLVLAGGRSTRMGRDKGSLVYASGLDQRTRGLELLGSFCERVFVSCRREQEHLLPDGMPRIYDELEDAGPAGGILAAWRAHPVSWLVLACDFPYADERTVSELVLARSRECAATAFVNADGFLEPLFAVWEPEALRALADDSRHGHMSPLRTLSKVQVFTVTARDPSRLTNVNHPVQELSSTQSG